MRIAIIGALLLCIAWPAQAQDCRNLTYLTGVPISVSGAPMVPVSINQKPAQMILDTGAAATQMTRFMGGDDGFGRSAISNPGSGF